MQSGTQTNGATAPPQFRQTDYPWINRDDRRLFESPSAAVPMKWATIRLMDRFRPAVQKVLVDQRSNYPNLHFLQRLTINWNVIEPHHAAHGVADNHERQLLPTGSPGGAVAPWPST